MQVAETRHRVTYMDQDSECCETMRRRVARFSFIVLAALAVCVSMHFLFCMKRDVIVLLKDPSIGEVLVLGESEDRFEEWRIFLCWRKENCYWLEYPLANEVPVWKNVEIAAYDNQVAIYHDGKLFGCLDTESGSFKYEQYKYLKSLPRPSSIILTDDPFERTHCIFPESDNWTSFWPRVLCPSHSNRQ